MKYYFLWWYCYYYFVLSLYVLIWYISNKYSTSLTNILYQNHLMNPRLSKRPYIIFLLTPHHQIKEECLILYVRLYCMWEIFLDLGFGDGGDVWRGVRDMIICVNWKFVMCYRGRIFVWIVIGEVLSVIEDISEGLIYGYEKECWWCLNILMS